MKKLILIITVILFSLVSKANQDSIVLAKLKSIKTLPEIKKGKINWNSKNPEDSTIDPDTVIQCGDSTYWELTKMQKQIIPSLINNITNTSKTNIPIPCSKDTLTIGGLAFIILNNIISIPYAQVTKSQWCVIQPGCGFNGVAGFITYVQNQGQKFQGQLKTWYSEREANIETFKHESPSECRIRYNAIYGCKIKNSP
tara:strand:+ start:570 stop:1163 length:594 start_codon:yes stop_codon:yes gene_type:complete